MERYVIIGLRGTGKSTIGRLLADTIAVPFHDTDALIQGRTGLRIPEIFSRYGEEEFRRIEQEVIASLPAGPAVIATGGGAVMDPGNRLLLRQGAHIILLTADQATLAARTRRSGRPPLTPLSAEEEIHHLAETRGPVYRGLADLCISTTGENPDRIVARILRCRGMTERSMPSASQYSLDISRADLKDIPLIYAITGNPVSHSRSPDLYNRLFSEYCIPGRYIFLPASSAEDAIRAMRTLGTKGLSVTIPFKETMVSCIDEPDEDVTAIGALNTVVGCGDRLYGHNTDWIGVREPLSDLLGADAIVVGAGGAAAAAVYALLSLDMRVQIANRTPKRGEALAERFGCTAIPLQEIKAADLIINATSVGMKESDGSPVPSSLLKPGVTVFDLVYTPPMTPLLREAESAGCTIIRGTEMFIYQAKAQFRLLTGIDPDPATIREVLG